METPAAPAIQARHLVGDIGEDGEFHAEKIIVTSDMVPENRVLHFSAADTGGVPEVLVHPDTRATMEADGTWEAVC